jgi:hypothetical protein
MNAVNKASPIDPLLHPKEVAKLLGVSVSWLAKSRLSETARPSSRSAARCGILNRRSGISSGLGPGLPPARGSPTKGRREIKNDHRAFSFIEEQS